MKVWTSIWFLALTLSMASCFAGSTIEVELSGSDWIASSEKFNAGKSLQATVPGSNYVDLYGNKQITDPYYRYNDQNLSNISLQNWTYVRQFNLSYQVLQSDTILLVCDGLDTVADVFLNGKQIGHTNNMFIKHTFNVTQYVKNYNTLKIAFSSPVLYARGEAARSSYDVPPDCPPSVQHGACHPNFIRKEQSSFSWDWGPSFPTQGIWKDIRISASNGTILDEISVEVSLLDKNTWIVDILGHVQQKKSSHTVKATFTMEIDEARVELITTVLINPDGSLRSNVTVPVTKVSRWWPNGYGQQYLYLLKVTLDFNGQKSSQWKKIGFRTIELVQEPIPQSSGLSFYFKVNGLPMFMKGSNWIPADSFQSRVDSDTLKWLLFSARNSHMNMLRVWGGGIYEQEAFYALADELGILIWQDIMFACAMYPTDKDFLSSVDAEVTYQVHRLKHHPSIAVWAGSNENEAALRDNWYNTSSQFDLYKRDFVRLYIDTVKKRVNAEHPSGIFISSSPTNGVMSEKEGWVAENPYDTHYGDVHYYDYSPGRWYNDDFPRSRFMSEYGVQSWPSMPTLKPVTLPQDWSEFSDFAINRNHHGLGQDQINAQIRAYFNPPNVTKDLARNFSMYSYLTQINQAMYIRMVSEFCRRSQTYLYGDEGFTMGALYWQLNDIWQAPSWSSIEYGLGGSHWKMLQYYAKKFFAPSAISMAVESKNLTVYIIRDHYKKDENVTLTLSCYSWDSNFTAKKSIGLSIQLANQVSVRVYNQDLNTVLTALQCTDKQRHFLYVNTSLGLSTEMALSPYKDAIGLKKANITVTPYHNKTTVGVRLTSDAIAPFVWLETSSSGWYFSDNGFLMITPTVDIQFYNDAAGKTKVLQDGDDYIISLMDLYAT